MPHAKSGAETPDAFWTALHARDPAFDGLFVFAVRSTGIYCRPSCPARRPKPENVMFFALPREAAAAGYRPCKRCRPDAPSLRQRRSAAVEAACRRIETAEAEPRLADLAAEAVMSAAHFQRLFKAEVGLSPKQYAIAKREERLRETLPRAESVTAAIFESGHPQAARVYERAMAILGMRPSAYRAGGRAEEIWWSVAPCALGRALVAGTARGLCAVRFGDDDAELRAELGRLFPGARLIPAGAAADAVVEAVLAHLTGTDGSAELPLDIRGTAFQTRVWRALRALRPGETASYAEIAARIGQPRATRAVANACGANPLAVLVPCHRVRRGDGGLGGYRWGVERKRALLAREAKA